MISVIITKGMITDIIPHSRLTKCRVPFNYYTFALLLMLLSSHTKSEPPPAQKQSQLFQLATKEPRLKTVAPPTITYGVKFTPTIHMAPLSQFANPSSRRPHTRLPIVSQSPLRRSNKKKPHENLLSQNNTNQMYSCAGLHTIRMLPPSIHP